MNCHDPAEVQQRILEHELIHYKLWMDREKDWGHNELFRQLAWTAFGHQSITHGIGAEGPEWPRFTDSTRFSPA